MLLTRHGRREWGFATAVLLLLGVPAALAGWWWALIPLGLAWVAVAGFFRDPLFRSPASEDPLDLISPADGRISRVERVDSHPSTEDGPAIVVRIFLSVLDVHLNRAPCDAEVVSIAHTPGRYLDARSEESAKVNESNLISLRSDRGTPIGVRQVSGAIARRIVCPIRVGDRLQRAARFGMIKFGSTTELIVPDAPGTEVRVGEGDRVVGGVTILVRLPD
jgi:phosphatidylserine decarboxylase